MASSKRELEKRIEQLDEEVDEQAEQIQLLQHVRHATLYSLLEGAAYPFEGCFLRQFGLRFLTSKMCKHCIEFQDLELYTPIKKIVQKPELCM